MYHPPTKVTRHPARAKENRIATREELKLAARVENNDEDTFIDTCLAAAKTWVEGYIKRSLDDYTYQVTWLFMYPPEEDDEMVLGVAPVSRVTDEDGNTVEHEQTSSGFNSSVLFDPSWSTQKVTLDATVTWGDGIQVVKLALLSVGVEFYRNREMMTGRQMKMNEAILNSLNPYRREV